MQSLCMSFALFPICGLSDANAVQLGSHRRHRHHALPRGQTRTTCTRCRRAMLIQASAPRVASDLDTKGALWCGAKDAAWQGLWFAWMADGTTRGMDAKSEWVHLLRAGTVCNPRRPRVASICVELSQLHSTLSRGLPRTVRHSTAQNPNTAVESALVGWPRSGRPRPLQSSAASRSLTAAPHAHTHTSRGCIMTRRTL